MRFSHSLLVAAPPRAIFARYRDIASWPIWDVETVGVDLPGLYVGAEGVLTPRGGPKARIKIIEMTSDRSFTVQSSLPLCRMVFGHELREVAGGTEVTHWVEFTGLTAPLFRRLIGRGIDRSLPTTLRGLKDAVEGQG